MASYLSFAGQFYEKIDSMAMGSPLFPVIANFFMEDFGEMAPYRAAHKPLCWFSYVDDTIVFWPHEPDRMRDFYDHLNSVHWNIQFTIEREGHLRFLDIDIYRRLTSTKL
jgi:hypothetical protein